MKLLIGLEDQIQPLLFLKLDFAKAYDKVYWEFLFQVLEKIGVDPRFISYVKLLFCGAAASL